MISLKPGYDIRDLWGDLRSPSAVTDFIQKNARVIWTAAGTPPPGVQHLDSGPNVQPIDCRSFDELCDLFSDPDRGLYFPRCFRDALATLLAVNLSTRLPGQDKVWLYLVGPPSSGKSTLIECLAAAKEYCKSTSKFYGLHSGWKTPDGEDVSLLNVIQNKSLLIKDFTSVLNLSPATQDNIYGELRDAYDGVARTDYRNKISREYNNINFTLICGVTAVIHNHTKSSLGERFLKLNLIDETFQQDRLLQTVMERNVAAWAGSAANSAEVNAPNAHHVHLKAATTGFINHMQERIDETVSISLPEKYYDALIHLSQLISACRTEVPRDSRDRTELLRRPQKELGARLLGQLTNLTMSLAYTFGLSTVNAECLRITRKVALDTSGGFNFDIIKALATIENGSGLSARQIGRTINLSENSVTRRLQDLQELSVVKLLKVPNNSGVRGRRTHLWCLKKEIRQIIKTSGVLE